MEHQPQNFNNAVAATDGKRSEPVRKETGRQRFQRWVVERFFTGDRSPIRQVIYFVFAGPTRLMLAGLVCLIVTYMYLVPAAPPASTHAGDTHAVSGFVAIEFFHELLRDIGIAFLVAVAVSVAIERIASERREHEIDVSIKEVQRNAMAAVFNSTLPAGWLNFVRSTLQDRKFYRSAMRVTYNIREPTASEQKLSPNTEFVICDVTMAYRIRNTSHRQDDWELVCYVELPWEKDLESLAQIVAVTISGNQVKMTEDTGDTDKDKLKKKTRRFRFGKAYRHKHTVHGQGEVDVEVRVRQVNYARDTTTFTSIDPSDSLTVHLIAPEGYRTYAILKHPIVANFGEGFSPVPFGQIEGESSEGTLDHDTWVYTADPCFPSTCVELSWVKDVTPPSDARPAPVPTDTVKQI